MAIKNEAGEKCSPKDLANEILISCLERVEHWIEAHPETIEGMTERELGLLNDQILKQSKRCYKILGATEVQYDDGEVAEL